MELKVIGINSGLGVSLYPFRWDLVGNMEERAVFHSKGDDQWKANFNKPLWRGLDKCLNYLEENKIKPNVVISSPDCGSGSVLRYSRAKKLGDNKKNKSLATFFEAIKTIRPKFFLFENLESLFESFPEEDFNKVLRKYTLVKHIVSVAAFGNSQVNRKRLIIVGIRKKLGKEKEFWDKMFSIPKSLYGPQQCHLLYGDLKNLKKQPTGMIRELQGNTITIYAGCKMTIAEIKDKWVNEFHNKKRWEVKDRKFTTAPGVYRNLDTDFPATARKANRQFDQDGYMLTPRHLARIQGVPDSFKIVQLEPTQTCSYEYWINKGRTVVTKTPPYEISVWFQDRLDIYLKEHHGK